MLVGRNTLQELVRVAQYAGGVEARFAMRRWVRWAELVNEYVLWILIRFWCVIDLDYTCCMVVMNGLCKLCL